MRVSVRMRSLMVRVESPAAIMWDRHCLSVDDDSDIEEC
jgi:hypothetical protein